MDDAVIQNVRFLLQPQHLRYTFRRLYYELNKTFKFSGWTRISAASLCLFLSLSFTLLFEYLLMLRFEN